MRMIYAGCATKMNINRGKKVQDITNTYIDEIEKNGFKVKDVKIEDFENALHVWILYE